VPGPAGNPHFDLPAYVLNRLKSAGIGRAEALNLDTYSDAERFYSYRRSTHLGEPSYGRQISMIGLTSSKPQPKS
jgi:copper oxidase (laccase) domain-containing protein